MFRSTNTAAPSVNCLHGANKWDVKSLELFASVKKCTQLGSSFKRTSSSNGILETEGNGDCGYESKNRIFNERGWEMKFKNGQKPSSRTNARAINKTTCLSDLDYRRTSEVPHRYDDKNLRGSKPFKTFKALA